MEFAENRIEAEADALNNHEASGEVRGLLHDGVGAAGVEESANRLRCVVGGDGEVAFNGDEFVEVAEVVDDVGVGDVESGGKESETFNGRTECDGIVVDHHVLDHLAELIEFRCGEVLDQAEVKERDSPV